MDISNGRLGFTQDLDNQKFLNALRQSNRGVTDFNAHLQSNFNQSLISVNDLAKGVTAFLTIDMARDFITQMVKIRGEFEQTEIAFNTMLQSREKGNALMQEMVELAKNTPMQFSEVSQGAKQLLAYQVEAEKLTETLSMLGDISSGLGVPMSRLILVYGQVRAKGRLMGDDLRQFTEAGVPMIAMIAKNMGVAQSAVADMVSEGKVGFKDVEKVLQQLTDQGGLFYNMMEEQSKTIPGQIAKLQDEIEQMFNDIGKDSQGFVTDVISGASYVVEHYKEVAKILGFLVLTYGIYRAALIATIALQRAQVILGNVQAFLQLASSIRSAKDAQLLFNMAVSANPYAIAAAALAGLIAILYNLNSELSHAEKMQNNISEATENATKSVKSEQDEVSRLIAISKDENLSKEARLRAIKRLNEISPQYLGNLNLENINTQLAVKAVDAYSTALYKNAKAKAFQAKYDDIVNKRIETSNKTSNDYKSGVGKALDWVLGETKGYKDYNDVLNAVIKNESKVYKTREQQEKRARALYKEFGLDKKHLELAQYDAQLIDFEKELIKSQADIEKTVTEIDQTVSGDKKKTKIKKSDDPFEIYKKQIHSVKEDYERFVDYMNSDDLVLKNFGKIQYETLSKSGATYEDYLRKVQKQLVGVTNKTSLQVKQLRFINDELAKTIEYNAFDKFKEGIEESISESENLLEVLGKIQEEKSKLQGNTDQISIDKLKFLDEKEIENIKKADDAVKDLIRTLSQESKPLDAINKKFDAQLFLLKKKVNDANDEIGKLTISANSSSTDSNERIKIEERILKLKKEILDTQNLIDFNESKRAVETKNVTNNTDYNKLLSEYQSYEDKIKAIDDKMKADLLTNQNYYESEKLRLIQQGKDSEIKVLEDIKKAKDAQIKKQATDETSGIVKDQLMGSEEWANLFSNMDEMSVVQIDNLIKEIETKFNQLKGKFNPIDLNAILKQLRQARKILIEKNPFGELAKGFADLFTEAEAGTEKNTDSIVQKWDRVQKALDGSFEFIDDALKSTGALKEGLGETAKAGLQAVTTTISSALAIKATVKSAKEGISSLEKASVILAIISAALQIAQAIAKFLSNIFSKDKKREKQIKEHKRSVDELTNAYKDLEDAVKRALGSDVYSGQKQMIENLKQQQIEYQKMIELEKGKKKKDSGKIKEWEDALRDSKNTIQDLLEEIAEDVVQTNAKDLATELGDALVEAFGKGEDAAKAFGEVANNVLKNAVLNQLKKQFLEKQLQAALDKLYKDMGGDDEGNFNWNGLSPEEQQEFRDKLKEISQNFTGMLDEYSDLFKDLTDPNENSLSGAIKGVSEETASLIAGQINAMRLLIVEANQSRMETNRILIQSLERLANIDFNTKAANLMLEKMYSFMLNFKDNTRSYGF
ncbi:tape measure protein [Empedobacter brevis]|uniref:tape measure protein n=1 Tax=Empedobacter brevis TaxID=247 RepID=UPI00333E8082